MTSSAPLSLYEHAVLITGGARRLGAAMARTLHGAGCRVMIHHRDSAAAAQALVDELNSLRAGSAASVAADLNDLAVLPGIVAATISAFGRLDVLVNNASTFYPTPIGEITAAQFDDLLGSNLRAPLFLSQAAAPALRQHGGLILNMVDIHAFRPLKRHPVYSAAKAGLAMLTQSLARELAPEIRVNGIAPGPVMWPEGEMDADLQARIIERTALKRIGSADDIARAALFFVRDAPYVTGQILPVDGGRTVSGF
ncbi:MAG: pteridine reductase [Pseudomonadota bacterium]